MSDEICNGCGKSPSSDWIECDEKIVHVCRECFEIIDPDMWISRKGWESINPVTPFEQLQDNPKVAK